MGKEFARRRHKVIRLEGEGDSDSRDVLDGVVRTFDDNGLGCGVDADYWEWSFSYRCKFVTGFGVAFPFDAEEDVITRADRFIVFSQAFIEILFISFLRFA